MNSYISSPGLPAPSAVIAPTLLNSWVNDPTTDFCPAGYWKDALGMVHVRGWIVSGANNAVAFVLPVGYRSQFIQSLASATGSSSLLGGATTNPNGNFSAFREGGSTALQISVNTSFRAA